jgi:hypothetical protein
VMVFCACRSGSPARVAARKSAPARAALLIGSLARESQAR